MSASAELTASTRPLSAADAVAGSRVIATCEVVPGGASAASVMLTPGTRSAKVLVAEVATTVSPIVTVASRPARTVAPPSRSEPSAPVVADSTTRRYWSVPTLTAVARRPVALAGSLIALTSPASVPSLVTSTGAEPSSRSSRRAVGIVPEVVSPTAFASSSRWLAAVWSTRTEKPPGPAAPVAATATFVSELVAETAVNPPGLTRSAALVASAATLVLSAWRSETTDFSEATRDLSRDCGAASSCMNWSTIAAVSRPLPSPLMLADPIAVPSRRSAPVGPVVPGGSRRPRPARHQVGESSLSRSAEEGQHALRGLVGLRQHRRAGLGQDLRAGEAHHLLRHVGVADARLRRRQVLDRDVHVVDGVLEPVLDGTELATLGRDLGDLRLHVLGGARLDVEAVDRVLEAGRGRGGDLDLVGRL